MVGAGEVGAPEALDRRALQVALALQQSRIEQVFGPGAQGAAQPGTDRHGKADLGALYQRRGHVAVQQLAQGPLA